MPLIRSTVRYGVAICATALAWMAAAPTPARADQWNVEKAGFNLYRVVDKGIFIRTEACDAAPASGRVEIQKHGETRTLTFAGSTTACAVRDFLVPVKLTTPAFSSMYVQLTQDQSNGWYRVQDGDLYLKTAGCISRVISQTAELHLNSDGTGWVRLDGRNCAVEHAFKRFNP